ncbi:MAG: hypothetical protein KatS3mg012_0107 [Gaiellaceae bacterium]|nr:MAG: hypothetical protein KatS3mg012_0107 [Gaiellaceae bacterium]
MAENTHVRLEVGFDGGQILSWLVTAESADALDRQLAEARSGTVSLEAQDGPILVVVDRVLYVRRFARESRVGFAD